MNKIPTLFRRNPDDMRHVLPEVTPGCEWVLAGEGVAKRKYDGTCVMLDDDGRWWARREVKPGKQPPPNWVEVDHDEVTGKRVGWEPIEQSAFMKFHAEAVAPINEFGSLFGRGPTPGTYELVGPKVNGNPERAKAHRLESHDNAEVLGGWDEVTFEVIREHLLSWIAAEGIEGIVWHHPDGRMAKLKVRDFPAHDDASVGAEVEG